MRLGLQVSCDRGGEALCVRRRVWRGRRDDAGPPASTNTVVLRLWNEPRRVVHDLERRLIRVPPVAGDAPCGLCCGLATPNRMADERLRECGWRCCRKDQDDQQRIPNDARHPNPPRKAARWGPGWPQPPLHSFWPPSEVMSLTQVMCHSRPRRKLRDSRNPAAAMSGYLDVVEPFDSYACYCPEGDGSCVNSSPRLQPRRACPLLSSSVGGSNEETSGESHPVRTAGCRFLRPSTLRNMKIPSTQTTWRLKRARTTTKARAAGRRRGGRAWR